MKRSPVSSIRIAPSPRTASLISFIGRDGPSSAVGWNWTNSQIGEFGTGPRRKGQSLPEATGRIGAVEE